MAVVLLLLCFLINGTIQEVLISNAGEHTKITAQKLKNQLDYVYDKMQTFSMSIIGDEDVIQPVSYTHLDVYKRQHHGSWKCPKPVT